jgi:hypothetical protein
MNCYLHKSNVPDWMPLVFLAATLLGLVVLTVAAG